MTTPDQETPKNDTPIPTFKADPRSTLAQLPPAAGAMFHAAADVRRSSLSKTESDVCNEK